MTTASRNRSLAGRGALVVGAAAAGAAAAALSPGAAATMWLGICAATVAAVNGFGKSASP